MYVCVVASTKLNWEKISENYQKNNNLAVESNHA